MARQLGVCAEMLWLEKPKELHFLHDPAAEWILEQDS